LVEGYVGWNHILCSDTNYAARKGTFQEVETSASSGVGLYVKKDLNLLLKKASA
jgi:hypothetical protein